MSTVILDTITGKSTATTITIGSTPVVSASANSMTIRGEGSNQTSIQQGLAKSWVNFNGTGTIAARDSLNVGSLTDNGAGDYSPSFSTNMGNASYSITMMSASDSIRQFVVGGSDTTSSYRIRVQNGSSSNADTSYLYCTIHGDLA
jgi:hypothetical protein